MWHRQRSDQCLAQFERNFDHVRLRLHIGRHRVARVEGELKRACQIAHRFGDAYTGIEPRRCEKRLKSSKPHDVIGVRMRENYRIHIADIFAKCLRSEVPVSTTHEHFGCFNMDGGTQPVITRIRRMKHVAITTDHRHTLRRSSAEECQRER